MKTNQIKIKELDNFYMIVITFLKVKKSDGYQQ